MFDLPLPSNNDTDAPILFLEPEAKRNTSQLPPAYEPVDIVISPLLLTNNPIPPS